MPRTTSTSANSQTSDSRVAAIDAPKKVQAFGNKAREALGDKVFQQSVRVEVIDIDRYRREVGRIYLGERFINMKMVRDGFAWRYVQYDKPGEFTAAEADAREHKRGLWLMHTRCRRGSGEGRDVNDPRDMTATKLDRRFRIGERRHTSVQSAVALIADRLQCHRNVIRVALPNRYQRDFAAG